MMKMFFFIGFSLILFLFKNILFLFLILELLFFSLLMFFISFNSNMYFLISLIFIVSSAILGLIILIMNIRSFSNDSMKINLIKKYMFELKEMKNINSEKNKSSSIKNKNKMFLNKNKISLKPMKKNIFIIMKILKTYL